MQPTSHLAIHDLTFERNNNRIFKQVSCTLETRECLQVRGANGSGKSTLLRILAGFIAPHAGNIFWQGQSILAERDLYQQQLHYIGHQNGMKSSLTAYENLQLSLALSNLKTHAHEIKDALHKVNLSNFMHTPIQSFSAGQMRRLSLARLALIPASLWILDEPTTALDTDGQHIFVNMLNHHLSDGGIAIVATHHVLPLTQLIKTIELGDWHD